MDRAEAEQTPDGPATSRPATPAQRLAALVALLLLLAAAGVTSWWILTDRADFTAARRSMGPGAAADAAPPTSN